MSSFVKQITGPSIELVGQPRRSSHLAKIRREVAALESRIARLGKRKSAATSTESFLQEVCKPVGNIREQRRANNPAPAGTTATAAFAKSITRPS